MKQTKSILNQLFKVNEEEELSKEEEDYKIQLETDLLEIVEEEGEVGSVRIREIVLDDLLKHNYNGLISYLSLEIDAKIKENLDTKLASADFLKHENLEESNDFFNSYLQDNMINDLIESLKGYERKAEGSKETFNKKRGVIIPSDKIEAIRRIIMAKFNKMEFLSSKDDNEQAQMIKFILEEIFEILLEIPNDLCNTEATIEIMTMCSVKLMNAVGLLGGLRTELMDTVKESKRDNRNQNVMPQQQMVMQ